MLCYLQKIHLLELRCEQQFWAAVIWNAERVKETISHLLVDSPNAHKVCGSEKPGTRTQARLPAWVTRIQALEPSPLTFKGPHSQEAGIRNTTGTWTSDSSMQCEYPLTAVPNACPLNTDLTLKLEFPILLLFMVDFWKTTTVKGASKSSWQIHVAF